MADAVRIVDERVEVVRIPGGAPGIPGTGGKSAYQLALEDGFDGSESQWLASLKGADGAPGPSAVSADAGNAAVLGTDDLIYVPDTSGGASNWGELGGTLSDQTDLQTALNAKANTADLGTAAIHSAGDFATAAQGAKADSAVQPGSLAAVATSGAYGDLSGAPTLGTAAAQNSTAFATAAQGAKADSALQAAPVTSVNTKTGAVSLTASDVGASPSGAYVKPAPGIPSTDMTAAVQTSLGKADTALQSAPVTSVASKTGVVTLVEGDVANLTTDLAAKAPLASPAFTGSPTVPTQTAGDNSTKAASTAFVATAVTGASGGSDAAVAGYIANASSVTHAGLVAFNTNYFSTNQWIELLTADATVSASWATGTPSTGSRAHASDYIQLTATTISQFYSTYYTDSIVKPPTYVTDMAIQWELWIPSTNKQGSVGVSLGGSGQGSFIWRIDSSASTWGWAYERDGVASLLTSSGLTGNLVYDAWNTIRFEFNAYPDTNGFTTGIGYVNGVQVATYNSRQTGNTVAPNVRLIAIANASNFVVRLRNIKVYRALAVSRPEVSTGTAAPTTTPGKIGDKFIRTDTAKVYIATGVASSADWTLVN